MKTYGPIIRCNSKTLHYVKCIKCPPVAITHAIGTNHHRSIAWLMTISLSIRRCLSLSTSCIRYWQTHSCSIAELLQFKYIQFGSRTPSWIWPEVDFHNTAANGNPSCNSVSDFNRTRQCTAELFIIQPFCRPCFQWGSSVARTSELTYIKLREKIRQSRPRYTNQPNVLSGRTDTTAHHVGSCVAASTHLIYFGRFASFSNQNAL